MERVGEVGDRKGEDKRDEKMTFSNFADGNYDWNSHLPALVNESVDNEKCC